MAVIWGSLDRIDEDVHGIRWIQLRTVLRGGTAIRTRVVVGGKVLIARGIERVNVSSLREGETVEVSYHHSQGGFMEAETIYVQPERVPAALGSED
jgi:hypothetical protein